MSEVIGDNDGAVQPADKRLATTTGNRAYAAAERADDLYETPAVAVKSLLKIECVPLTVLEPCCGPGAIVAALRDAGRAVVAYNLRDYGCPDSTAGVDFLMETKMPDGVPAIVMNPPFKLAEQFINKAIDLAPEVYVLLRLGFLAGLRWADRGLDQHLARVHVFSPRLPMMHRDGWAGPRNESSGIDFAWYTFMRDWKKGGGTTSIEWINWKRLTWGDDNEPSNPAQSGRAARRVRRRRAAVGDHGDMFSDDCE